MRCVKQHLAACGMASLLGVSLANTATAHSASDAYLTLSAQTPGADQRHVIHGQWDIAIRDLDFVLKLDDDGNGQVTWGEMRKHQAAITTYVYRYLKVDGGTGNSCALKPTRQMIDDHADGAYAALFFDVQCAKAPRKLIVNYTLFFKIDPSHRGVFVLNSGGNIATALLSPENAKIDLTL